jgi:hypothetical protein
MQEGDDQEDSLHDRNLTFEELKEEILRKDRLRNELKRFMHPWTGVRIPEVVDFDPHSCSIIDDGKVNCEYRGIIYYLGTGGSSSEPYVNPGDTPAVLERIRRSIEANDNHLAAKRASLGRLQDMLAELEAREPLTEDKDQLIASEAASTQLISELQGVLRLDHQRIHPNFAHLRAIEDEIRRLERRAADAHARGDRLRRAAELRETLSLAIAAHRDDVRRAAARAAALRDAAARVAAAGGLVRVAACAWQRGRAVDVLGGAPAYSWSDYVWEEAGAPWHPLGARAGAWFEVRPLPPPASPRRVCVRVCVVGRARAAAAAAGGC